MNAKGSAMERITEHKLKNKRFRNTETAIIISLLSARELLSPTRLVRLAHISRSTLHRHHHSVHEIVPNYERYILRRCRNIMRFSIHDKHSRFKSQLLRILVFISANKQIMQLLLIYGERNFIESLIVVIGPKLIATGKIKDGEMLRIYIKEVAAIIEEWGLNDFDTAKISVVYNKIVYLTDTARARLRPLANFDA